MYLTKKDGKIMTEEQNKQNTAFYRSCLLLNEKDKINMLLPIKDALLGRKLFFKENEKIWEVIGVCSSLLTYNEMLEFNKLKEAKVNECETK